MASYMDEQNGKDNGKTRQSLNTYSENEEAPASSEESQAQQNKHVQKTSTETTTGTSKSSKGGLLHRARNLLFGPKKAKTKNGGGLLSFFGGGLGSVIPGKNILTTLAKPKMLAIIVTLCSVFGFSIFGLFTTYKNDGVVKNDPPLQCEPGELELPGTGEGADNDVQENVNIMYDIFCNQFGYPVNFLKGMLACMGVESGIDPARLESDFILKTAKEQFVSVAGPDSGASADTTLQAYYTYGQAFQSGGGWNGNSFYIVDGHMCCGIGLIQWTAGRAISLIEGIDKVTQDVSVFDLEYQCAFLLAEMKTTYTDFSPDNAASVTGFSSPEEGVRSFFRYMVSGGSLNDVDKRLARLDHYDGASGPGVNEMVDNAVANSEFTEDTVSMAEILADDSFTSAVAKSNTIQLCKNKTYIDVNDIAKAAVSISFIEGGDYKNVAGAYGEYRRATRSPLIINDWDFQEGVNGDPNSHSLDIREGTKIDDDGTDGQPTYANHGPGITGKLDCIACTEYYYFAHLIAFPKETGVGGNIGFFSSCDRGTATAVRIAGADDKFPAGNPKYQLLWAVDGKKAGSQHDPDRRMSTGGNGGLWEFAGFLRGNDYYPASATSKISPGTVMISWSIDAANGTLNDASMSGATASGVGDDGGVSPDAGIDDTDPAGKDEIDPDTTTPTAEEAAMALANLRWPNSNTNTTRHIITYVGDSTVQAFWGMEWLFQQYQLFGSNADLSPNSDPASKLIKGDLDIDVPQIMKAGLSYKDKFAQKGADQRYTFLETQSTGAMDNEDKKLNESIGREDEYNLKTGLPEFKAWEEIFVRLIHNSDDDAAAKTADGDDLYTEFELGEDNYYDSADDQIEQYQTQLARGNKSFFEDWNTVGAGDVEGGGTGDYDSVDNNELPWYDDGSDRDWTMTQDGDDNPFWRYELVTDIEYRCNQFLRFGMASLMCTLPSEEDADVWQLGDGGGNDTGHIIGNVYRRFSRIPDETDVSGRYFYYNTVVSNDMLQDLTQLWSIERNGDDSNYEARNFGPMYLFSRVGSGMDVYDTAMQASMTNRPDRRYGLTAKDIEEIMNGVGGLSMGSDGTEVFKNYFTVPMHAVSYYQKALYNPNMDSNSIERNGAHEDTQHVFNSDYYDAEIYALNPFLALEGSKGLNFPTSDLTGGLEDWSAGSGKGNSQRNAMDGGFKGSASGDAIGVDGSETEEDDRLAWIDRHYVVGQNGNINMLAYMVAALNSSTGKQVSGGKAGWESALESTATLDAEASGSRRDNNGKDSATLASSWGLVRYTDYIYGEDDASNEEMGRRLLGGDHRQDGETRLDVRDDYNRREWIVIPYYHTHAQMCFHDDRLDDIDYAPSRFKCPYYDDDCNVTDPDTNKIDTQLELNAVGWDADWGDTIDFGHIDLRGKYNMSGIVGYGKARYFLADGTEISYSMKPPGHQTCNGQTFYGPCQGGCDCDDPIFGCQCGTTTCPACGKTLGCGDSCYHNCEYLLSHAVKEHGPVHNECDEGDYCHDHWGCNYLEYCYHSGIAVYMAIPVVENPTESFQISNWMVGGTVVPDKANLLQAVQYNYYGFVQNAWSTKVDGSAQSLTNPNDIEGVGVNHIADETPNYWNDCSSNDKTIGYCASGRQGLLGYFTIEGNAIRSGTGGEDAETINEVSENCVPEDLQRCESIRNRVGYGKSNDQTVNGVTVTVYQGFGPGSDGSGIESIRFDPDTHGETGVSDHYGYGEVAVVGSQHGVDPKAGNYGHNDDCGPDGKNGNGNIDFGNSLLREILGDEHVFHVTYGSQDKAGLTRDDLDNGRDFQYYTGFWDPEKKQMASTTSSPKLWLDEDGQPTDQWIRADGTQNNPNPAYTDNHDGTWQLASGTEYLDADTGEVTTNATSASGKANTEVYPRQCFRDADEDEAYVVPFTKEVTEYQYSDPVTHKPTDQAQDEFGNDNDENIKLYKGDNANWVTHASRGTRGMMTQYLNFKSMFKVVHSDADESEGTACYMLFRNISRKDDNSVSPKGVPTGSADADGDGDLNEGFIYQGGTPGGAVSSDSDLAGADSQVWGYGSVEIKDEDGNVIGYKPTNFTDTYGQGDNSHWRNLIDLYNAAMSETRHYD